jgi:hypothetical protein
MKTYMAISTAALVFLGFVPGYTCANAQTVAGIAVGSLYVPLSPTEIKSSPPSPDEIPLFGNTFIATTGVSEAGGAMVMTGGTVALDTPATSQVATMARPVAPTVSPVAGGRSLGPTGQAPGIFPLSPTVSDPYRMPEAMLNKSQSARETSD